MFLSDTKSTITTSSLQVLMKDWTVALTAGISLCDWRIDEEYILIDQSKLRFKIYSQCILQSHKPTPTVPETFSADISSDADFEQQYSTLTDALLSSAKASFRPPTPSSQFWKITNPTIKLILTELHHINCLLSMLSCNALPQFLPTPLGSQLHPCLSLPRTLHLYVW